VWWYEKEADASRFPISSNAATIQRLLLRLRTAWPTREARPKVELGIFQTHPPSSPNARRRLAENQAARSGIQSRAVEGATQAAVTTKDGASSVMWKSLELLSIRGANAPTRAETSAKRINELMRAGLKLYEIAVKEDDKGAMLSARGLEIARITVEEAKAQNLAPLALCKNGAPISRACSGRSVGRNLNSLKTK
jgi:hypothetical protein